MASNDSDYTPYVVCQGDHLRTIAMRFGLEPAKLWDDPKNARLKDLRGDGDVLHPGDLLYVPTKKPTGQPLRARTKNRYRAKIPTMPVALTLSDADGPLADQPYEVRGLRLREGEPPPTGTTDGDGRVSLELPVDTRLVEFYLPKRHIIVRVKVGDMDPIDEETGVVKRLMNVGVFSKGTHPARADIAAGLCAYQQRRGLRVTGRLDQRTRDELEAE